jgi:HAD superfamily hydrolase (TIGR01450 family)
VRLDDVRGFVFDIDGTLAHRTGDEIRFEPGAHDVLARIRASGRPFVLFTNGSHGAPETLAGELRAAGIDIRDKEVLVPLDSVQWHLARQAGRQAVLLLGTDAAREYLERCGVTVVEGEEDPPATAVFVAWPERIDFAILERAARAVLDGARLLTASYVPGYAGANGIILSRGAMTAAAIAKVTGARPVIVGKPSRAAVRAIGDRLGMPTGDVAVIGDDVLMDIPLGKLGGSRTILVRAGISGKVDLGRLAPQKRPDAVVDSVAALLDWI